MSYVDFGCCCIQYNSIKLHSDNFFTWNLGPMIKPFGYFFTLNRLLDSLFVDHRIQKREHAPVDSIKSNWFSIS